MSQDSISPYIIATLFSLKSPLFLFYQVIPIPRITELKRLTANIFNGIGGSSKAGGVYLTVTAVTVESSIPSRARETRGSRSDCSVYYSGVGEGRLATDPRHPTCNAGGRRWRYVNGKDRETGGTLVPRPDGRLQLG